MKASKTPVYIEFKEYSAHVLDGDHAVEFPLERQPDGRIAGSSAELFVNGLRDFLSRHGGGGRSVICALPARGVTIRTIALPSSAKDDPARLLTMQIEAQFPVAPAELAWGYLPLHRSAANGQAEFIIAAVKKDLLTDYNALVARSDLSPLFTIAALNRGAVIEPGASFGFLEVGAERSELLVVDEKSIPSLRVLNWGRAHGADLEPLRKSLTSLPANSLYLANAQQLSGPLKSAVNGSIRIESLPEPSQSSTSALEGLRRSNQSNRPVLFLGQQEVQPRKISAPTQWKWAAVAALLLFLSLSLRYAEAMLFRSGASRKLSELAAYRNTLPKVDRELGFLNYIKTNQPPYLDTIAAISSAAPSGTRLDQLSIAKRGDVSLRGSMQDPQGPENFRSKLIASGFFSKVVVEEQVAIQNPQKVNFRISGSLKPDGTRPILPPEPPRTNQSAQPVSGFPSGPMNGSPRPANMPPPNPMPPNVPPPGVVPAPNH